ncbi:Arc family DNA-binding protein [Shinella sp. JR1-6]|uniref:Arc family DNA-binding protein n=1 Tax=Shinella sp. JR1-6 TaxID=2527671 RepID=UPI00102D639F|nr:Arc family DNA-binding protein [Shinella sp. JR1-6]TAA51062.1 Arc family DNA-binding protein [Shinella sp. JR1-6]
MAKHPTGRGSDQFVVRFPDGMREELKVLAANNGRSLNAEIILRLRESMDIDVAAGVGPNNGYPIYMPDDLADKVARAATRMNRSIEAQALDTLEKSYLPPKP